MGENYERKKRKQAHSSPYIFIFKNRFKKTKDNDLNMVSSLTALRNSLCRTFCRAASFVAGT